MRSTLPDDDLPLPLGSDLRFHTMISFFSTLFREIRGFGVRHKKGNWALGRTMKMGIFV